MKILQCIVIGALALAAYHPDARACTRVVYVGADNIVLTGRNLDWKTPIPTNLYVMPRGIDRTSSDRDGAIHWRSRYGSVIAVGYDIGISEGMNERGLVCNLLYLPDTKYTHPEETRAPMSSSLWAGYILDNYSTVDQAVADLSRDFFHIVAPDMPGGASTTLHAAIADASGNSAIIEYIDGKLTIHHGEQCRVLTNAPVYDQQLAVNRYWEDVGGMNTLPGTNRSSDRFVRATFYLGCIPDTAEHKVALAGVFGVLFNCAVPVGIVLPDNPEVSQTQWRSVADHKHLRYYFATTYNPSVMWVDLMRFDLSAGSPIMKLDIIRQPKAYIGDVRQYMNADKGFVPLGAR